MVGKVERIAMNTPKSQETILEEALCLPPQERAAYLADVTQGNPKLRERIAWLAKRRLGRPPHHVVRQYTSFHYRAKSWSRARRDARRRSARSLPRARCTDGRGG